MPYRLVSDQMLKEHEVLARLADALRTAIQWGQHGNLHGKLSAVQFLSESFQRHLERMLDQEEQGGYLDLLARSQPDYYSRAQVFREEHQQLRTATQRILQSMTPAEQVTQSSADAVFNDLLSLLEQTDAHNKRELDFLQEVILHQQSGQADPRD